MRDYMLKLTFDEIDMIRLCVRQMLDDVGDVVQLAPLDSAALVQVDEALTAALDGEDTALSPSVNLYFKKIKR